MKLYGLALLVGVFMTSLASAETSTELRAELVHSYDSNVPRLSHDDKGAETNADSIEHISAGGVVRLNIARQRIDFDAEASRYFYHRLTHFNHTNTRAELRWQWELGHTLQGTLAHSQDVQLTSFTSNQGNTPDRRRIGQTQFLIDYSPHPDWHIVSDTRLQTERHTLLNLQTYDRDTFFEKFETRFQTPPGNFLGVRASHANNALPKGSPDNSYQNNAFVGIYQTQFSAISRLNVDGGYQRITLKNNSLAGRNFSSWTARATYEWTGHIHKINLETWRHVDPLSNEAANFVIEKGITLTPRWDITSKVDTEVSLSRLWRQRPKDPGDPLSSRQDNIHTERITLNYATTRNITLALSLEREARRSNIDFADYEYYQVNLRLLGKF